MQGIQIKSLTLWLALIIASLTLPQAFAEATSDQQAAISASQQMNINQATAEQLVSLPGIGPARAAAIVELREELGSFTSLEDLKKIRGIGPATAQELEPLLSF